MRIAAMAAGAVGGYFGARMAAAGHDVAFIARGAHRDAMRRDGLKIESTLGVNDGGTASSIRSCVSAQAMTKEACSASRSR